MKNILILLLLAGLVPALCPAQEKAPLTVAVLDFQAGDKLERKGAEAALLLSAKLSASPDILLVERQEIEKALGEQEIGLAGTVTPDTAAKVGQLVGAKVIVTGRVFDAGDKVFLVAKIISVETSRVYGETATFPDIKALDKGVDDLAEKVQKVIAARSDTLVAPKVDRSAVVAELKKSLEGKHLPVVSVSIPEQHIGRPIVDPAAQTEMKLVLQEVGFTVLDSAETAKRPDVQITGEAFSEMGMRKGNLVSGLARVEVKVVNAKSGDLIAVDRQRGVAVDLGENVAAKEALQNAGWDIIVRLIPKIAAVQ